MKKINVIIVIMLFAGISCVKKTSSDNKELISLTPRTTETENLLQNLKEISTEGFMFGHQDDPLYGVYWEGDSGRSDIHSVVGDYPAVMGFDIGKIEHRSDKNIDNVLFTIIREEIIRHYKRGAMITISWHVDNPLTGGDSWDVSSSEVVRAILPGGSNHDLFLDWLDRAAVFFNTLITEDGAKIPILFRPWHEHTGSWFWWGKNLCTVDEYNALWEITRTHFDSAGVDNLLYSYSPDMQGPGEIYMERYPGDEYVDLLGIDGYHRNNEEGTEYFVSKLDSILSFMTEEGARRNKPIAITETGLESIPISDWWTEVLLPLTNRYPISYVLVWRNARERPNHYYAPYPGQKSETNFVKFYDNPRTLFSKDISSLYE
ncbi:MAG TPA: glycosyl hydrolase [Fermentimonas sp.]|nr:glycosyl hydrolase [Fermentimonas sp.]